MHHGQGEEALALARRLRPAVILLAIAMANSTGVELRRQLSADPHTAAIPVIALAASRILRLRAHEIQAHDYLATPVDADELLLRIAKWAGPRPGHPG